MLRSKDPEVVDLIASLVLNKHKFFLYHFASRYCNYHFPNDCPIYNEFTRKIFADLHPDDFLWSQSDQEKLNYQSFKVFMERFRHQSDLEALNYFELDKFIWIHGEDILADLKIEDLKKPAKRNLMNKVLSTPTKQNIYT